MPRSSKLPWVIALLSVVGAAGAVYYLKLHPGAVSPQPATSTATPIASSAPIASASTSTAPSTSPDLKEQALTALGRVASGEVEAGVKELEALSAAHPSDPTVLHVSTPTFPLPLEGQVSFIQVTPLKAGTAKLLVSPQLLDSPRCESELITVQP